MKKVLIVLLMGFMFFSVQGQEKAGKQKLTRQEKKELRRQQDEDAKKIVDAIIEARQFVLEANLIKGKRGQTFSVSSTINFVMVDSNKAVFQFGSAHTIGVNGVGGATVEGKITRFDVNKREKSGSYFIRINISATTGFYEIRLEISSTGMADAQVTALSNKKIGYSGRIVPLSESSVFQGMSY